MQAGPFIGLFRVSDLPDPLVTGPKPTRTWRWVTGEDTTLFSGWDFANSQPEERTDEIVAVAYSDLNTPAWSDMYQSSTASYLCENKVSGK